MQVTFEKAAVRTLRKMPAKDRDAMIAKLETFATTGAGDVKKLKGSDDYRLRHGDWRAIFEIAGNIVVVRIAHRREVYR